MSLNLRAMLTSSFSCTFREYNAKETHHLPTAPDTLFTLPCRMNREPRHTPPSMAQTPKNQQPDSKYDTNTIDLRFIGQTKLHSLLIYTAPTSSAPKTVKLFKNRDDLDFSLATELSPIQTLEIPQPQAGVDVFEIPLNRAHWNTTTSVTLFFEDNWSDGEEDVTKVGYIGFKGQFMRLNREPMNFLYEAAANPSDHVSIPGVSGLGGRVQQGQ